VFELSGGKNEEFGERLRLDGAGLEFGGNGRCVRVNDTAFSCQDGRRGFLPDKHRQTEHENRDNGNSKPMAAKCCAVPSARRSMRPLPCLIWRPMSALLHSVTTAVNLELRCQDCLGRRRLKSIKCAINISLPTS